MASRPIQCYVESTIPSDYIKKCGDCDIGFILYMQPEVDRQKMILGLATYCPFCGRKMVVSRVSRESQL